MIILNIDKTLIRVESWSEILDRPGFTTDLDPAKHELKAIIGRYQFGDFVACGLSNCHQGHGKGYIVVTKDGRETNIGQICGKAYFGVDFVAMSRKFDQDITDQQNRDRLWTFSFNLEKLKQQIECIRQEARGADWIYHQTRCLVERSRGLPDVITRRITSMVKQRNNVLTIEREATEAERLLLQDQLKRSLPSPHYVEESIAIIDGLEALYPENDLRELLILDIEQQIQEFENETIDTMTSSQLSRRGKWLGELDAKMERARLAVVSGRRLLRAANLRPFSEAGTSTKELQAFESYLKVLELAATAEGELSAV